MQQHNPTGIYAYLTAFCMSLLDSGTVPWECLWTGHGIPMGLLNGLPFAGINTLHLASLGYRENFFLSLDEIMSIGASVKENEKGHPVIRSETEFVTEEGMQALMTGQAAMYNIEQCNGIDKELVPPIAVPANPIGLCFEVAQNMPRKAAIRHQGKFPSYSHGQDLITMPLMKHFHGSMAYYYATLFYQLAIAAWHPRRLNHPELFGKDNEALKSLAAYIGRWHLLSMCGIVRKQEFPKKFCQRWKKHLESNPRLIFDACTLAQKAVNYILDAEHSLPATFGATSDKTVSNL